MGITDTLKAERERIVAERDAACREFDEQLADIDAALSAIVERHLANPSDESLEAIAARRKQMPIDDAIVEAVKNGVQAPVAILKFMEDHLGVQTTVQSIRSRVSRMGKEGRLERDETGWIVPTIKNEPPEGGSEAGEADTSPNAPEQRTHGDLLSQYS